MISRYIPILLFMILLAVPSVCNAHKLNVFASAEEGQIYCEAFFSGGRPAKNTKVMVVGVTTGDTFLTGKTDNNGKYQFPVVSLRDHNEPIEVIIQTDDGHRNSWKLTPDEYRNTSQLSDLSEEINTTRPPTAQSPGIKKIFIGLFIIFSMAWLIHLLTTKRRRKNED